MDPNRRTAGPVDPSDADPEHDLASGCCTRHASSEEFLASRKHPESLTNDLESLEETLDIQRDAELVKSLHRSLGEAAEGQHLPLPGEF